MAEERLIDDDLNRDKKYRIRKNADGEDELYIDESAEEEFDEVGFDVPEFTYDDEDAAVLTPEQLAAREDARREEDERRRRAAASYVEKAKAGLEEGDFESALYAVNSAEQIDSENGEICYLKLKILSRNFTDYTLLDECAETAEGVREYCTEEQKQSLAEICAPLEEKLRAEEEIADALHVEVEVKKTERREVFLADRKKSITRFTLTVVPCIACLIVALAFASIMFAERDGTNLILTIVFAALAFVFFIASLATGHFMWAAMRRLSLNEKNSSTRLGREYEQSAEIVRKLYTILTSFKDIQ